MILFRFLYLPQITTLSQVFLLRQLTILLASTVGPDPSDDAVWSGYRMFALNHFCSNVWGRYAKLTLYPLNIELQISDNFRGIRALDKRQYLVIIEGSFVLFLIETICCDPSSEPSH